MSRGFVKEDDLEHAGTDQPERPISLHPNYVTASGYAQLQAQAEQLDSDRLRLAASKEDSAVQQQLVRVNRNLRYIASRLETAMVTKPDKSALHVLFGATVEVEDAEGNLHQFTIVGEDEADIQANKVSWISPLAKALIGHKVDDEVLWLRPAGNITLIILAIHYQ
ncbi:MAG: transcription elongation factor GreAB [Methylophilaceae bacterium]|nr:transcription elongation factor GreAB [Methylophilaceae bacterium]